MEVASSGGVTLAADGAGAFIWPDFLPAFDATATLVNVLHLLVASNRSLSSVVTDLPRVHMARETVAVPWERKGTVMREMAERNADRELVLVDGVKVLHPDGWALVLPDPEEPIVHVAAEADSDRAARRLAEEYTRRIRQLLR
jgi:mannose-1-phosphate guanylyltransferase / phosphomannomutase